MGDGSPEVQAALAWQGLKEFREEMRNDIKSLHEEMRANSKETNKKLDCIDNRLLNVEKSLPDDLQKRLRGLELWRSWALGMSAAVGAAFSLAGRAIWDAITGGKN